MNAALKAVTLLACIALPNALALADQAQATLRTISIKINNSNLETEIAISSKQRYMGLSFRKHLGADAGMLFVYSNEQMLVFTMRNTLLPLSIAYIAEDLTINEIQHMNVGPKQLFPTTKAARYALEVNQGWFATNNIKPGDKLILP
ncbi:MAG: DUF192 domain-containing protein [Granulosicoccaceae bacterium]